MPSNTKQSTKIQTAKRPSQNRLNGPRKRPLLPYDSLRHERQRQILELTNIALRDFKVADASPDLHQVSNKSIQDLLEFISNLETQLHLAELSQTALQHDRDRCKTLASEPSSPSVLSSP
jgi:hypothetical protein